MRPRGQRYEQDCPRPAVLHQVVPVEAAADRLRMQRIRTTLVKMTQDDLPGMPWPRDQKLGVAEVEAGGS